MQNDLVEIIRNLRVKSGLTLDNFSAKYGVSAPAIYKFEQGHVRPSLDLWLKIAKDSDVSERRAVILWARTKLPERLRHYAELPSENSHKSRLGSAQKRGSKMDYAGIENREEMRTLLLKDKGLPQGLRELLADPDLWALYKPTGHEINFLRDVFAELGSGTKATFREALRLIREFAYSF